jgi:hydrogenase expression/formation protein HypC
MCLAVPGRVAELYESAGVPMARVDFGGIAREACMAYLPEAVLGEYVLIHAGFAISKMDEEEARKTLADLETLAELADQEDAAARSAAGSGAS